MSAALVLPPTERVEPDGRAMRLAAALAAVIVRPLDHLDGTAIRMAGAPAEALSRIARHPAFRAPVNRAVSRELRFGGIDLGRDIVERLRSSPFTRLSALLVSQPMASLREAATLVAAAILHGRVVGLVLRADRERSRAILGETGFRVAIQEAPLLHAPLADLDTGSSGAAALSRTLAVEDSRTEVAAFGAGVLGRFVATREPALRELFEARWPAGVAAGTFGGPLPDVACEHILRLLRRRLDSWAAIIG